ncbi:MAG: aminotransferase class III-fold pyridoxal phosphate-dependent enzyme, partial [Chloroflexi bacterium]|nr:aminotransferase class III-fold pyridoxal phosphate-dependent enzyme [Chloroflexota bacterium]
RLALFAKWLGGRASQRGGGVIAPATQKNYMAGVVHWWRVLRGSAPTYQSPLHSLVLRFNTESSTYTPRERKAMTAAFFPALRKMCDKYGILLIADEVQSGMGRTGKWWAIENFGVEPDIFTTAKGIASGIPLGACVARRTVMDWSRGAHGNTYGGNPLSCVAAIKTIELIEREYMKNAAEVGEYTQDALAEMAARHPSIGEVRGMGLMIGVEFVSNKESKEPAPELRDSLVHHAFERGLLLLGCAKSVIRIAPPLSINKDEINHGLEIFEEALTLAEKEFLK